MAEYVRLISITRQIECAAIESVSSKTGPSAAAELDTLVNKPFSSVSTLVMNYHQAKPIVGRGNSLSWSSNNHRT